MALPLRILCKLRIERAQKFALAAVFSLAIFIIIVAIVRIVEINPTFKHVDPVWLALWSMTEASVGTGRDLFFDFKNSTSNWQITNVSCTAVVVACLPSFHVLLTSRSTSAFNRRNPSNLRLRQQQNITRQSEVAPSGSSVRNNQS